MVAEKAESIVVRGSQVGHPRPSWNSPEEAAPPERSMGSGSGDLCPIPWVDPMEAQRKKIQLWRNSCRTWCGSGWLVPGFSATHPSWQAHRYLGRAWEGRHLQPAGCWASGATSVARWDSNPAEGLGKVMAPAKLSQKADLGSHSNTSWKQPGA